MTKQVKADLILVLVAVSWSFSYYMTRLCLSELGPFALNACRFIIAFTAVFAIAFKDLRKVSKTTLGYSVLIGSVLATLYAFSTFGIKYTSVSNAGFLVAMSVVFTPIFAFIFKKVRPEKKLILVVIMSTVSIALITLNEELKPALGDILCIISAVLGAAHVLLIESAVRKEGVSAAHLGVYQLAVVGVLSLAMAAVFETSYIPVTAGVWGLVLLLAVFCTGFNIILLTIAQQYTTATHVGVILTLEPVLAGFVAYFLAGEVLLGRAYIGAAILIAGILIMEIDIKKSAV